MKERLKTVLLVILIAGLLLSGVPARSSLVSARNASAVAEPELSKLPPLGAAGMLLLGGFRGLAVDALWMRVLALHQQEQYEEEIALVEFISRLQPYNVGVWVFQSWNISYNISVMYASPAEQWKRVKYGIEFLEKGAALNPKSGDLYFYLGWFYYDKIHQNIYFEEACRRELGVNNFEKAVECFRRSRDLGGVEIFTPMVIEGSIFHCYIRRAEQILGASRLDERLRFPSSAEEEARVWTAKAVQQAAVMNRDWPNDAAFMMFPARVDLVYADGYMQQIDKTLAEGKCSDESIALSEKLLDKSLGELAKYRPKYEKSDLLRIFYVKSGDAWSRIPRYIADYVVELVNRPFAGPEEWKRGLELLKAAREFVDGRIPSALAEHAEVSDLKKVLPVMIVELESRLSARPASQDPVPAAPADGTHR